MVKLGNCIWRCNHPCKLNGQNCWMPHLGSCYQLVFSEHLAFGGMRTVFKDLNLIRMLIDKEQEVCFSAQAYTSKPWFIKIVKKNIMTIPVQERVKAASSITLGKVLVFVLLYIILPCVWNTNTITVFDYVELWCVRAPPHRMSLLI